MRPATLALVGLACFAGFAALAHVQATAANDQASADDGSSDTPDLASAPSSWNNVDLWGMTTAAIESQSVTSTLTAQDTSAANLRAFLDMIASSEGTDRAADPYRVCYGYRHTIADLADHPAVSGEWRGESIANLGPQYAGKVSTAAGRYQLIKPTWIACRNALRLADFSPASQDAAAVYLIKARGALAKVQAGEVADAIRLCRNEWASLPGGDSGQPQRRLEALLQVFDNAGGSLA